MRNKKRYLIDDYLEDVEFDDFGNRGLKPMISNGVEKDSLRGQNIFRTRKRIAMSGE